MVKVQRRAASRGAPGAVVSSDPWDRGQSDPRRVFEVLNRHGVDFTVIGGIAVIVHGHPRNTRDIDFVAATDRPNLERLAAALRELNAQLWGVDAHLLGTELDAETLGNGANFTFTTDAGGLDFFNEVPGGVPYEELRARALVVELSGLSVRIASRDDLIRMKSAVGRPQDIDDIAALTDPAG
jgi:predicted nucleotidyltransferase